jgi:hypothetical protein
VHFQILKSQMHKTLTQYDIMLKLQMMRMQLQILQVSPATITTDFQFLKQEAKEEYPRTHSQLFHIQIRKFQKLICQVE